MARPGSGAAPAVAAADPWVPRRYRVAGRRRETSETVTIELEPLDAPISPPEPGQFTMVTAFGVGEVPISVSADPGGGAPLSHTIRSVGAVTAALCGARRGSVVGVRGPFGTDWGVASARGHDLVLVAGGIGLAPLRPVLQRALRERDAYGRIVVLVGARSPDDLPFQRDLRAWRAHLDVAVEVIVDYAGPGWRGDVGVVTKLIPRVPFDPTVAVAMVCGPEVMMRFTAQALEARGVDPSRIRVSLERNMKCAIAQCGHCQLGPVLVCRDGPVLPYEQVAHLVAVWEL